MTEVEITTRAGVIRHRAEIIAAVAGRYRAGESQSSIARALGIGKTTVQRILVASGLAGGERTHCKRGHPLSGDNVSYSERTGRECVTCRRERKARWKTTRRRRAPAAAFNSRKHATVESLEETPAVEPKPEPPKLPTDIRRLWSMAEPGSTIRRRFPTRRHLEKALWDPYRQVILEETT